MDDFENTLNLTIYSDHQVALNGMPLGKVPVTLVHGPAGTTATLTIPVSSVSISPPITTTKEAE